MPAAGIIAAQVRFVHCYGTVFPFMPLCLVPEGKATVHAVEQPTEQADFVKAVIPGMAVHPVYLLRQLPCVWGNDQVMGILHLYPFLFWLINLFVLFVRYSPIFVLYHIADINLVPDQLAYCHVIPHLILVVWVRFSNGLVIIFSWRQYPGFVQLLGNLAEAEPLAAEGKNFPHNGCSWLIDNEAVGVLRVFGISIRGIAPDIPACLTGRLPDGFYLAAGIACIKVVHDVLENHQHPIVLIDGVNVIVQRNEAASKGREDNIYLRLGKA